jgi:heme-degrading monooxygenase HmoA
VILEHALLPVVPGQEDDFLAAFAEARPIISGMPGCRSVRLARSVETPHLFVLLVEWDTLEQHTVGFRGSPEYQRWKALLHRFYRPFPDVGHFVDVPG